MDNMHNEALSVEPAESTYEAPAVESVLAPEEMEREVLYAGNVIYNDSQAN